VALPPLTRVGFGSGPIGKLPPAAHGQALAAVDAAYTNGVRLFDTAPFYGRGQAERWLGEALAGRPRDSYVLSTKAGRSPVGTDGQVRAEFDFSRDSILRSLEESLTRLGVGRIDIALIHDPDDHWHDAVTYAYPALAELRDQGVIGAVGVGMNQWQMPLRFIEECEIDLVLLAGRYTLLEQGAGATLLPECRRRGVAVLAAGVFNSGLLATNELSGTYNYGPAPADVVDRARAIAAICATHGVTLPRAALAFPGRNPAVTSLLVGAQTADEVRDNLAHLATPPPEELWLDLTDAGLPS
jgi:D-threo-aldose 1-dehydrogenase